MARRRLLTVGVWVLVLAMLGVGSLAFAGSTDDSFSIPGQESTKALGTVSEKFGSNADAASAQVVVETPPGQQVTSPENAAGISMLVDDLKRLPGVVSASNPLDPSAPVVSPDLQATYSTVTYDKLPADVTEADRERLDQVIDKARSTGLDVEVTGTAAASGGEISHFAEAIGVVVAFAILGFTFASLVVAGLNLLTALVGVGIGALGVTTLTGFVDLSSTTPALATMIGLAVGIDYALFIITRFRTELRSGHSVPEAVGRATGTAGSAVVTAGFTVMIALAGLAVVGIPFLSQMGLAAAATVFIAVLVAVTLVPASLSLLGRRILPRRERSTVDPDAHLVSRSSHPERGLFQKWVSRGVRYRWASLLGVVVLLGAVTLPVFSMQTSLLPTPDPASSQGKAEAVLADHFGPGVSSPLLVLVDGPGALAAAEEVTRSAGTLPNVAFVAPPVPSRDGSAALVSVIPASDAQSPETLDLVHAIRSEVTSTIEGPSAYVTGSTAVQVDVTEKLSAALPVYLALVVGLALVLLVLVFRSLLVPLVGVLGFLLSVGTAFGSTVAVFQWGWLSDISRVAAPGPLNSLMPIIVTGVLFGLAMDYQIFLVSRIHEAHTRGASPRDAVQSGFVQAAPVVLAAAGIMFAVFAGFLASGDEIITPIAFALAVGIAADAVLVRMILIPAALSILGEKAWALPRFLRWIPSLDVEGSALEEQREPLRP